MPVESSAHYRTPTPPGQTTRAVARGLDTLATVLSAALAAYWSIQIARGTPDAYIGQHRAGLLLSVAVMTGSASQLLNTARWRMMLLIISLVCLATAFGALQFGR
jgi:hypothetical protein